MMDELIGDWPAAGADAWPLALTRSVELCMWERQD